MDAKPPHRPDLAIGAGDNTLPRSRSVLLLVDFINPLQFPGADSMAPAALQAARCTAHLKQVLAQQGVPAVYANDNYGTWRSQFSDVLQYCQGLPGEAGEIARLLAPGEGDLSILKPRHSAFYATPLELLLTQMHAHELIVVGLSADMCVQVTAMDAYLRGYTVWAPADCTAAEGPERLHDALAYLERVFKADVCASTAGRTTASATEREAANAGADGQANSEENSGGNSAGIGVENRPADGAAAHRLPKG